MQHAYWDIVLMDSIDKFNEQWLSPQWKTCLCRKYNARKIYLHDIHSKGGYKLSDGVIYKNRFILRMICIFWLIMNNGMDRFSHSHAIYMPKGDIIALFKVVKFNMLSKRANVHYLVFLFLFSRWVVNQF